MFTQLKILNAEILVTPIYRTNGEKVSKLSMHILKEIVREYCIEIKYEYPNKWLGSLFNSFYTEIKGGGEISASISSLSPVHSENTFSYLNNIYPRP